MKKAVILALAFLLVPVATYASEIAVVDVQEVVKESVATQNIRKQMKTKQEAYREKITKQEDKLRKKEEKLSDQRSLLSAEAFDAKRKDFQSEVAEAQRNMQEERAALEKAGISAMAKVRDSVNGIISDLAKEKGFSIAIPASSVMYAKDSLDITKEVLERLNKKLSSVKVVVQKGAGKK